MQCLPGPLDSVISNEELGRRPARAADRRAERRALQSLVQALTGCPRAVLQKLSDAALELSAAHSAGISLAEEEGGQRIFRWHAVSGQLSAHLWDTLPRDFSPCGTVLDRKAAQLMILPERYFTPLVQLSPRVFEVLLIPFSVGDEIVGTVWIVAHDETRHFDTEDRRVVTRLAQFAAVAYAGLSTLSSEDVLRLARLDKSGARPRDLPARSIQKRVLIVDDKVGATGTLAALLHDMGHQVHVAHDGRSAMEICLRVRPHIVLLEVAMPGTSGVDLGREMRQILGPGMRIVAVTGYGSEEDRRQSIEAGFDLHLIKPLDPDLVDSLMR